MADLTLSPRDQLLAGLKAFLWPALSGLVPADGGLRHARPDKKMVAALVTGEFSPIVTIVLGTSVPARGVTPRGRVNGPVTGAGQDLVTVLREVVVLSTPVTFVISAGGITGGTQASRVATALVGALGATALVPLPDAMETEDDVDPQLTRFGLVARLDYMSEQEDTRQDVRDIHRYDVVYAAQHSRYAATTYPVVHGVDVAVVSGR